ncbi:MAG: chromate transporter [Chloroflexi bacterium]|nr:chromate transporter [Chloroflexota bacterium]
MATGTEDARAGAFARAMLYIGSTSIGGTRIAHLRDLYVRQHRWLDDHQFLECAAISQVLPGANVLNTSLIVGYRLGGVRAAFVALLTLIPPGAAFLVVLTELYRHFGLLPIVVSLTRGLSAAGVALVAAACLQMAPTALVGPVEIGLAVAAFLGITVLHLDVPVVLFVLGGFGVWLRRPRPVAADD